MEYVKQVAKEHYSFEKYFTSARWMSYWYQIKEITKRNDIKTVLDVGPGTTFLKDTLAIHSLDLGYKSLDIAPDLKPDYLGSVTNIPIENSMYDAVCAFEVLEHIKFKDFESALLEMSRVSKKYIFISLPHFGPSIEFLFKTPSLKRYKFAWKIPYHPVHQFRGEHYWELGKRGYSVSRIRSVLQKHFVVLDEYVPFEHQYHHFFIMEKKS